jgi:NADPH2:quinone reductase
MKAIGLTKYLPINNPESLVDLQVATPEPSDRDILVRVEAILSTPLILKFEPQDLTLKKNREFLAGMRPVP